MKCLSDYLWQTIVPLIFFSFVWMLFKYLEKEEEVEKKEKERTIMELKFLKSQINPHVLFNNLNTIYAYALEKPSEAPPLILKLSENLKHVLYESNAEYIPLEKELQYIDNYISFQRIRTEGLKEIKYNRFTAKTSYKIAPLLLITLIENAFKHSLTSSIIKIDLKIEGPHLVCMCENEFTKATTENKRAIGLKNLNKRLNLLYRDKFKLFIKNDTTFLVVLKLTLI